MYNKYQWLFSSDIWKKFPAVQENRNWSTLPPDGVFRVWKKSDPATTAVYDRESVNYLVKSDEGIKYYHFFKNMLVGSEEHYFVSLLYNWNRTKNFVEKFAAQPVWNTWVFGAVDAEGRYRRKNNVHTNYITDVEFEYLRGFSDIGIFFARKFSSHSVQMLDKIDSALLNYSHPS
jgi:hypothetical protein